MKNLVTLSNKGISALIINVLDPLEVMIPLERTSLLGEDLWEMKVSEKFRLRMSQVQLTRWMSKDSKGFYLEQPEVHLGHFLNYFINRQGPSIF